MPSAAARNSEHADRDAAAGLSALASFERTDLHEAVSGAHEMLQSSNEANGLFLAINEYTS
jgi:hypothetical protein